MKRLLRALAVLALAALLALFTLDLRQTPVDTGPKISFTAEGHGPLLAGAGQAEIHVPYPVVPAGYGPKDRHEVTSAAQPQMARAIALQVGDAKLTLVSVDLLEIDSQLLEDLKPRLPKDAGDVWVCATHTHSGMGNYDPNLLAQIAGTGRFKREAREALLDAIASAVSLSAGSRAGAKAHVDEYDFLDKVRDRSASDDPPDAVLRALGFQTSSSAIGLVDLAVHPTTWPRPATMLSADLPALFTRNNQRPGYAWAAFFQGAVGNVAVREPLSPEVATPSLGATGRHREILVDALATAEVDAPLPSVEIHAGPGSARRAASNLVDHLAAPHWATLSVAHLGSLTLIAVPGEPTAAAGRALREAVGDKDALILGLCNGYVGYIETPDRVEKGIGESPRQYYDSSLLSRFTSAASLAGQSLGLPTRNQEPGTRN
ncbi:MAG: hypothetical protein JST54_30500 [Deltaproteobacteria bacterium]|nr:hypothetical protein [Deltaproteobacteria bacterium]